MIRKPGYLKLLEKGELAERIRELKKLLEACRLCSRRCGVNRLVGERGYCGAGKLPEAASFCVHRGEEPVLTGNLGVGNVFLGRCNMKCVFCQNHSISQPEEPILSDWSSSAAKIAEKLLQFQKQGCPTAGFVSPTHYAPQIFEAIALAAERGFSLPVIYNTNGYDSLELLTLLDGMVDIYLPDFKYWNSGYGNTYSDAPDYPAAARKAVREMYRQVGNLRTDSEGTALRGLIIRLLVLPGGISGTGDVLRFIADELANDVFVSLMSQYYPAHNAHSFPPLAGKLKPEEYSQAAAILEELGFENGWVQDPLTSPEHYLPGIDFRL
ncbi:radical SAM protein [Candidatus Fermentibacteria bacterium]|nr:MAG: radical SAM protein [Candidatus Fermentibacteria bacterium]